MKSAEPCFACASGNDLSEFNGNWCRVCGRGEPPPLEPPKKLDPLAEAVRKARGGDAPIEVKGYA